MGSAFRSRLVVADFARGVEAWDVECMAEKLEDYCDPDVIQELGERLLRGEG